MSASPERPRLSLEPSPEARELAVAIADAPRFSSVGRICSVAGLCAEAEGLVARVGDICHILRRDGRPGLLAEVHGFEGRRVLLLPLGELRGIGPGAKAVCWGQALRVPVGEALLGRTIDAFGAPLDGQPPPRATARRPVTAAPPGPLDRARVAEPLALGVRAVDGLLTCGKGQRLGIFSGSGVGKSVLLGMMARQSSAAVNVIALVGERGREVREFLERDLADGLQRSVVVAATAEQPASVRIKAGFTAMTIAEYFRDQGLDVLLMVDSLTRLATAQREAGLSAGETPTARGHTPSVFAMLPRLLERAGATERGTITGLYTVLVEADDLNEPVSDAARAILDGHIVLSRALAEEGHFPAVDVNASISRSMRDIVTPEHSSAATELKGMLAAYSEARDLLSIGAYQPGANPRLDAALERLDGINAYLRQGPFEPSTQESALAGLIRVVEGPGGVASPSEPAA